MSSNETTGRVLFDPAALDFVQEGSPAPDTVNPSLWRQGQLVRKGGLFKVVDRLYQVRNQDISNLTVIEGDTGLILMDPLISVETARAALELYFEHRPRKPVLAVLHSHSHVDHFGGIKGVVDEEDVLAGKVQIIAPIGFLEAAVAENVFAGNAMTRRALYSMARCCRPTRRARSASAWAPACRPAPITLIKPTRDITYTGEKLEIDGAHVRVHARSGHGGSGRDALVRRGAPRAHRGRELLPHAAQHVHARGAPIRDPQAWSQYLNETIDRWGHKTT